MPAPSNVTQLRSFLGSVQFYNKFLPDLSTLSGPLYHLTEKNTKWKWDQPQEDAFKKLEQMLTDNTVLAHFDPSCPVGISCDASDAGVGAVLFHRYKDNTERPIANASKTLTVTQKRYPEGSSIHRLRTEKFHQFLYGRKFLLVTDHKPLISMFGPNTATPVLAANRLARWSLMLSQYNYTIEYRPTKQHSNADALSRLPAGPDLSFDGEEGDNDVDTVCTIRTISSQLQPYSRNQLKDSTNKDPVIIDHAINFMGSNWLIVTDAYSKYPCIHQTSSTSTKATTTLLEEDFAHFGYPHTIVSDNATTFSSAEFQEWCHYRGIKHLTGAPYHPATNGAAERLVQSFKQFMKKSKLPPRPALQEFLMQYRRTPLNTGFSPSQLLNGRQIRTKIDSLLPSPAHIAQERQATDATKSQ